MPVSVCIPVFNEEANLPALLDVLLGEPNVDEIIAVDDRSTDASPQILSRYAASDPRLTALHHTERRGQLSAWLLAAQTARFQHLTFIDADARPAPGAVALLAGALSNEVVIVSGRVVPAGRTASLPYARFRANVIHRVRCLNYAKEAVIGRFFAVERDWFTGAVTRTDIVANDVYLSCLARRQMRESRYVPDAVCYYNEAVTLKDFAAQRQRADAGYAQLRAMDLLTPADEPSAAQYAGCLLAEAAADPLGAASWLQKQIAGRFIRAYHVRGRDAGGWETQASTKRRVDI